MKRQIFHEQAKFWRDPEFAHLEILRASYLTHSCAPHSQGHFVASIIDGGVGAIAPSIRE